MRILVCLVVVFSIHSLKAQDYINAAVVECCECFKAGNNSNQDSLMVVCSLNAIRNNAAGLSSDLELYDHAQEDMVKVLSDRMVKYFKKCPPIKTYFKQKSKQVNKSKD